MDFQIQQQTAANAKHDSERHALGIFLGIREVADMTDRKLSLVPGRYYYPDGQFYGVAWRILENGQVIAFYASKVQAEEKLAALEKLT